MDDVQVLREARRERRVFRLGAFAAMCAMVMLAKIHLAGVDRSFQRAPLPGLQVDVNSADEPTLAQLSGVGPERARRIVEYRESHGPFRGYPDLLNVGGIGPRTLETIAGQVSFGE